MSDVAFEQYAQQIDFLQVFQLEILQKKIQWLGGRYRRGFSPENIFF